MQHSSVSGAVTNGITIVHPHSDSATSLYAFC